MRTRIFRLALLAAGPFVVPAAASAQRPALPRPPGAAPAYEVPDRLLAGRADLGLTTDQVADLAALSAELHAREWFWQRLQAVSSKPWITAVRRPSPRLAFERALGALGPDQRRWALRLLGPAAGTGR